MMSLPVYPAHSQVDLDGDGYAGDADLCPHLPEDNAGKLDGCPSDFVPWYDQDRDGIRDRLDDCPALPEAYNNFLDSDGCPDVVAGGTSAGAPDSDSDGIPDVIDRCPNQPETYNNILDIRRLPRRIQIRPRL